MTTLIGLAAAGIGCGFVAGSLQVIQRPGVAYRPLSGVQAPSLPTALAWRDGALSAPGRRLLAQALAGRPPLSG
jgi:DNA-binding transcriptional LysR family regulator